MEAREKYLNEGSYGVPMSRKSKGINAERELVHLFWATGEWGAIRVAGSGSASYPSPDVLAGNGKRLLAIECKASGRSIQYLTEKEVEELRKFSSLVDAQPVIGVKFGKRGWFFLELDKLRVTESSYAVSLQDATSSGKRFEDLIG